MGVGIKVGTSRQLIHLKRLRDRVAQLLHPFRTAILAMPITFATAVVATATVVTAAVATAATASIPAIALSLTSSPAAIAATSIATATLSPAAVVAATAADGVRGCGACREDPDPQLRGV